MIGRLVARTLWLAIVGAALAGTWNHSVANQTPVAQAGDSLGRARRILSWFFTSAVDSIWGDLTPPGKQAYGSPDALRAELAKLAGWGREVGPVTETFDRVKGHVRYRRTARFDRRRSPMGVALLFDGAWHLIGWEFTEAKELEAPDPSRMGGRA